MLGGEGICCWEFYGVLVGRDGRALGGGLGSVWQGGVLESVQGAVEGSGARSVRGFFGLRLRRVGGVGATPSANTGLPAPVALLLPPNPCPVMPFACANVLPRLRVRQPETLGNSPKKRTSSADIRYGFGNDLFIDPMTPQALDESIQGRSIF